MPYSDSQMEAIMVTERIGASLSLAGSLFMVSTFVFSKRFRKPINRIMFYASFGNLLYTIPGFISLDGLAAGPGSSLCQTQAFLIQAALPADALWNLCMSLNVYFTVFKGNNMADLQKRERIYLITNSIPPFALALAFLFINTPDRGHIYGNAAIWCWISSEWEFLRVVACYGIAWTCIILSFTIYIAAGLRIRRERRNVFKHVLENGRFGQRLASNEINAETIVETTLSSNARGTSFSSLKHPQVTQTPRANSRQAYQVHISARHHQGRGFAASDPVQKYMKSCVLFFISLLATWVPSSVNRLWALAHPGQEAPFSIAYMAAFFLQLTGFWNSVVYITMSRAASMDLIQKDILPLMLRGEKRTPSIQPQSPLIWQQPAVHSGRARSPSDCVTPTESVSSTTICHNPGSNDNGETIQLERPLDSWSEMSSKV